MNRNGLGSALGAGFMHGSIGRAVVFKWMFTQELSQVYLWIFWQETCHYCDGELVKFNWPSRRAGPYFHARQEGPGTIEIPFQHIFRLLCSDIR